MTHLPSVPQTICSYKHRVRPRLQLSAGFYKAVFPAFYYGEQEKKATKIGQQDK